MSILKDKPNLFEKIKISMASCVEKKPNKKTMVCKQATCEASPTIYHKKQNGAARKAPANKSAENQVVKIKKVVSEEAVKKEATKKSVVESPSVPEQEEQERRNTNIKTARHRVKKKDIIDKDKTFDSECNEDANPNEDPAETPKRAQRKKELKDNRPFANYIPIEEAKQLLEEQSAADEEYVQGYIRINPKSGKQAYVSMNNEESDLQISSVRDRNRALEGDLVVAQINPEEEWQTLQDGRIKKTGIVVCILEKLHPRKAIGHIKLVQNRAIFYPRDPRIPLLNINRGSLSRGFKENIDLFKETLFLAQIVQWSKPCAAFGKVLRMIGEVGDIEAESQALLLEHDLNVTPYNEKLIEELPNEDYVLTDIDIKDREDWRKECVFTIDPSTAVDLDDAVSCKLLESGNYEIGVHIADVTHFLKFLSPLDTEVAKRATTVYMTETVYHMLPKRLCEVCSLLPGRDKLTFSVIWEMTPEAVILNHRFAKTVIKSCCQMAYEHAQMFIENPERNWPDDFLHIDGDYTIRALSDTVNELYKLSVHLRSKRFANGALRIGQPKLRVLLDRNTGLPTSYSLDEQRDSNRLIEEFMLLANMTVATHLYAEIPDTALLRNHAEPFRRILHVVKTMLEQFGVHIEIDSAGDLEKSLRRYELKCDTGSDGLKSVTQYRMMVINRLCVKAMSRAMYKCSSTVRTEDELRHYALNVPLYTHFTSPIRRYIDCMVHRLLESTMHDVSLDDNWSRKLCIQIATNCNIKSYNAKLAQEESSHLYFTYLISLRGQFIALAVALEIKKHSMDVIICEVGIKLTIDFANIKDNATIKYCDESSLPTLTITWKQSAITQVINVFTLLHVKLEKHPDSFRLKGTLLPPRDD